MHRSRAFTLIELLVVISIIALLVAILLPALGKGHDAAKQVVCLANTRSIAVAMDLYAEDDPRNFYPTARMPMTAPIETSWLHLTRPYVDGRDVYRCPCDRSHNWDTGPTGRLASYGINAYLTPNHPPYRGVCPHHLRFPSRTVLAAELVEDLSTDHFMPMFWGDPAAVPNSGMEAMQWDKAKALPKTVMHSRHAGERANYILADGHAAAHVFADTWRQEPGERPEVDWYDPKR